MSAFAKNFLDAGSASANGGPIYPNGAPNLFVGFRIDVTAATLQASIVFAGLTDPQDEDIVNAPALNFGSLITVAPVGVLLSNAPAAATLTLNNPSIGTSRGVLSFPSPPYLFAARYAFTSGGGTVRVQLRAFGVSPVTS